MSFVPPEHQRILPHMEVSEQGLRELEIWLLGKLNKAIGDKGLQYHDGTYGPLNVGDYLNVETTSSDPNAFGAGVYFNVGVGDFLLLALAGAIYMDGSSVSIFSEDFDMVLDSQESITVFSRGSGANVWDFTGALSFLLGAGFDLTLITSSLTVHDHSANVLLQIDEDSTTKHNLAAGKTFVINDHLNNPIYEIVEGGDVTTTPAADFNVTTADGEVFLLSQDSGGTYPQVFVDADAGSSSLYLGTNDSFDKLSYLTLDSSEPEMRVHVTDGAGAGDVVFTLGHDFDVQVGNKINLQIPAGGSVNVNNHLGATIFQVIESGGITTSPPVSAASTLALGTAYQNTLGYDVMLLVVLNITVNTTGVIKLGVGPTNTPTQQTIATGVTSTGFLTVPIYLPNGYYALLSSTGTITLTIAGQNTMPV